MLGVKKRLFIESFYISKLFFTTSVMSKANNTVYDLIVIGGGSGGLACAKEAASFGKQVAVLDYVDPSPRGTSWGLGGTCVNVGCIPKKLMHHVAQMRDILENASSIGWKVDVIQNNLKIDWSTMATRVQDYVKSLNWGHRVALRQKKVEYINAKGSFINNSTIKTVNKQGEVGQMTAKHFVIAVGGRPKYPKIPGALELGISSDDIFWLQKSPGKTLIVGGSYVALECAGFLHAFGCDTTVMIRSIPLRGFDKQMADGVVEHMEKVRNIKFLRGVQPTRLEKNKDGRIKAFWSQDGKKEESGQFDTVLFAIGRTACTEGLNLVEVGVSVNPETKKIVSDQKYKNTEPEKSTVSNIYAIGDVLDRGVELTPVAIKAGKFLAKRLFDSSIAKNTYEMDYKYIPTTVFTPLEYACVGLTEEESEKKLGLGPSNMEVYHCYYKPLQWITLGQDNGSGCYIKMICDVKAKEKVIGLHILGEGAGEIMQGFAAAIKLGITRHELCDSTVGIHPTNAEEVVKLHITKSSGEDPHLTGC